MNFRDTYLYEMRLAMAYTPRMVTKQKADLHGRMAERWVKHACELGRPDYHEASGFTPDRWQTQGSTDRRRSICGGEHPYGVLSRPFWRYVRLAMREAFLSGWHEAVGTTYETPADTDRRKFAVITGLV